MVSTSKVEGCCSHLNQLEKSFKILRPIHDPVKLHGHPVAERVRPVRCELLASWSWGILSQFGSQLDLIMLDCWCKSACNMQEMDGNGLQLCNCLMYFDVVLGENPGK